MAIDITIIVISVIFILLAGFLICKLNEEIKICKHFEEEKKVKLYRFFKNLIEFVVSLYGATLCYVYRLH